MLVLVFQSRIHRNPEYTCFSAGWWSPYSLHYTFSDLSSEFGQEASKRRKQDRIQICTVVVYQEEEVVINQLQRSEAIWKEKGWHKEQSTSSHSWSDCSLLMQVDALCWSMTGHHMLSYVRQTIKSIYRPQPWHSQIYRPSSLWHPSPSSYITSLSSQSISSFHDSSTSMKKTRRDRCFCSTTRQVIQAKWSQISWRLHWRIDIRSRTCSSLSSWSSIFLLIVPTWSLY